MDKYCRRRKIYNSGKSEYYFFTWSITKVSLINNLNVITEQFKMVNGYTYYASLFGSKDKILFRIVSIASNLKCFVSMIIGSKTLLLSNGLDKFTSSHTSGYSYNLVTLSSGDESFQKLKDNPNSSLAFICKIIYRTNVSTESTKTPGNTATDVLYNLRPLAAALRNSSESLLKEKVVLRVGEETQTVSKVILCAQSPVFAKMFENDMIEAKENEVTVTDIKMPVLKALVSFLYTGKLSNNELDFLCDTYYAADKYDVNELRQICVDLIINQISMENVHRVMKLAFFHNDELLKSTVMALIATNIETWFSTDDLINLVNDEPKIAAEVLNFFDF